MKNMLLPATLALLGVAAQAQGRIEQVLVYPGGATVERVVPVKAGQQQLLRVSCLSEHFDSDSLQILPVEGVAIGDITVQSAERATQPDCARSPLDERIRELEAQRNALAAELGAHELALGYLKNYGGSAASGAAPIAGTAEQLRRSGLETLQRQQALALRKVELERQLAPLTAERERLVQANPRLRTLLVRLNAARDTELRLSYRLNQAGWEPVYRAYLDSASGKVRLERHAQVAQGSGEDWRDVKLRLSTTQPRQASGLPMPRPWTLDLQPPPSAELNQARVAYAPAPPAAPIAAKAMAEADLGFDVGVFQGEFATEFAVPGRVNVAADGQRIALALGQVALDARLLARAHPRTDAGSAYLVAEAKRPPGIWPAGKLQLYRDGAFVGQSQLNLGSQELLDLYFGRDELLRISSEPEQRNAGNTGFIGSRAEQKLARAYLVENLHQRPFTVQILEAAPVARHEDIKVEARFEPPPAEREWRKQPGIVAWTVELAPGQRQRFSADYSIAYPKDARITGLPR